MGKEPVDTDVDVSINTIMRVQIIETSNGAMVELIRDLEDT